MRTVRYWWNRLLKRPVYCKQCGRYWPAWRDGKPCRVCGAEWTRYEDEVGGRVPWLWQRNH